MAGASKNTSSQRSIGSDGDSSGGASSTQEQPTVRQSKEWPALYIGVLVATCCLGLAGIWYGNKKFAPEMYDRSGPIAMAKAFAQGKNFATFDLNINIREMRDEQLARFTKTPDVAVLGASHWQEAHPELLPQVDMYNAHVHRDYYEDMPGVVEMFVRHKRLPKKMIIAIRDRLFTPVAARTDFLWLPGIPYYVRMAPKLGLTPHPYWETAPVQRWRELISASMLYSNAMRWYKAPVKPHETFEDHHKTLDTLRPGGSIYWSAQHQAIFTQERSKRLSLEFSKANYAHPPKVDPIGVKTIDRLLAYLKKKGVDVYLVHPPFNPIYFDRIKGGPYHKGLARINRITRELADKYGFKVFGSFDPAEIGCTAEMYIDAEHSNPECLGKVFQQFAEIADLDKTKPAARDDQKLAGRSDKTATDAKEPAAQTENIRTASGQSTEVARADLRTTDPSENDSSIAGSIRTAAQPPLDFAQASVFWHKPTSLFVSLTGLNRQARHAPAPRMRAGARLAQPRRTRRVARGRRIPLPVINPLRADTWSLEQNFADFKERQSEVIATAPQQFAEAETERLVPLPAVNPRRKPTLKTAWNLAKNNNWLVHQISAESKHINIFFGHQQFGFGLEQK